MTARRAHCDCGGLTVDTATDPIRVSICHCLACKRRTGSAFSWNARYDRSAVTVTGPYSSHTRVGDEGSHITHHFCPTCGVTVFYENSDVPEMIAVQAGTFGDANFPAPTVSVYHADDRLCGWLRIVTEPLKIWA